MGPELTEHGQSPFRLARLIRDRRGEILREWEVRTRELPITSHLDRPALVDHVPQLLEAIADMAEKGGGAHTPLALSSAVLEQHAFDRLDAGVDLAEVVSEYAVLRTCITDLLEKTLHSAERVFQVGLLNSVIDRAITESITRYTTARDRALSGFDRIAGAAFRSKGLDELLQRMLEVLSETLPAIDTASIFLRDGDRLRIRAAIGLEEDFEGALSIPVGEGFTGMIAAEGSSRALEKAAERPFLMSPAIRKKGVRALFGVPLMDGEDVLGVALVGSVRAERFSEQDRKLVSAMAYRVAAAIKQHLLRETAERRERQQEAAARLGILALESANLDELFQRAVEIARETFGVEMGRLLELLPGGEGLALRAGVGLEGEVDATIVGAGRRSLAGYTLLTGEPVLVEDLRRETRFAPSPLLVKRGILSALTVVIWPHGHEKPPYGVLEVDARARGRFSRDDISFLQAIANVLAAAIERDELERERRELFARLEETTQSLDTIVRGSPLAIIAVDVAGRVRSWNRAAERLFGWREAEVIDRPLPLISNTDDRETLAARLAELSRSGAAVSLELKGLRKDGSAVAISLWAAPRRDPRGSVTGTLVVAADVTEAKEARERLERAYRETQAAVRTREDVLAIVSHDLRNPLGAITVSTALLERRLADDTVSQNKLDIIHKSAMRMERLIADLVDMASIQAGRLSLERQPHDAGLLVGEAVLLHEPLAAERAIRLAERLELPEGTQVFCDRGRLLQVFSNLIGNAVKFCNPGDCVEVRAALEGGAVRFSVDDTGPGIPPDQAPHIFEPYWSGVRKHGGTGLGLFIARGIIEAHGGKIGLQSRVGGGTTFTFTVPVAGS